MRLRLAVLFTLLSVAVLSNPIVAESTCSVTGTVQSIDHNRVELSVLESDCESAEDAITIKDLDVSIGEVVTVTISRDDSEVYQARTVKKHPHGDCRTKRSHYTGRRSGTHRERMYAGKAGGGGGAMTQSLAQQSAQPASPSMDLATGGAKDINNFRRNIKEGNTPMPEGIRYEGLFYDYRFNIGNGSCDSLFCPAIDGAADQHPLTNETEHYAAVGLQSGLQSVERPPLNVVVAIDVSGSMSSAFDQYYYDRMGRRQKVDGESEAKKMAVARSVLSKLSDQLDEEDRLGVVLFNNRHHVARPLLPMRCSDRAGLKNNMQTLSAGGGTNLDAALSAGRQLIDNLGKNQREHPRSNRLIVLSDAMPNTGQIDDGTLGDRLREAADNRTYTTFVGVGLDANSDLIKALTEIKGSNAYFVNSEKQFKKRLNDEFKYMVTPLAFDVTLTVSGSDAEIADVYGTGGGSSTGTLMSIPTLFPSPTTDEGGKGSLILVRFQDNPEDVELRASYTKRNGEAESTIERYSFSSDVPFYDSPDARKGIVLTRHGSVLKRWAARNYHQPDKPQPEPRPFLRYDRPWHPIPEPILSEWERRSVPLNVSAEDREKLDTFRSYLQRENGTLNNELDREVDLLDAIIGENGD